MRGRPEVLVARFGIIGRLLKNISKRSLLIVIALLLACQTLAVTLEVSAAAPDPVAHWTLDEASGTRNDSIGSNHLSQVGTVNAVAGQFGNAASFPSTGGNKALTVNDNTTLSVGGETSFTMSLWVKLNSRTNTQVFAGKYGGSGEYALFYENVYSRFVFSTYGVGGTNNFVMADQLGVPAVDTWYHLTGVHNAATNTNSISVNGGTFDTISSVPEPTDTSAAFVVGAFNAAGSSYPALASVDDVKFWKTPLDLADIEEAAAPPSPLVAHWKFDEGSGTSAIDSTGNGYTGTISGATYSTNTPVVNFTNPYSLEFDGINDGVSTGLSVDNFAEFTLAGWAYPRSAGTAEGWFGANDVFEFIFNSPTELRCWSSAGSVNWSFAGVSSFLNNWHHITCLGDGENIILYVDGNEVARQAHTPTNNYGSGSDFTIGKGVQNGGDSGPFDGYIDDVRVYNRALTPEEMDGLGTGEAGPGGPMVPSVQVTSPAASSTNNTWNPVINWGDSDECAYSWNNSTWIDVACSNNGNDIPEPEEGENITLYIHAKYTGSEEFGINSRTFDYDTTAPTVNAGDNRQTNSSFTQSSASANDGLTGIDSYAWTKQSGPGSVTFTDSNELNTEISEVSLDGTYVLRLTVTDQAGNTATDDITLIWDTTSPEIELTDFPDLITNQTTASFSFSGSESVSTPITFACKIDAQSFNSCTSPKAYTLLSEGAHSVTIRATDSVGNMHTSNPYGWTIDTTAPVISLTGNSNVTVVQGQAYNDPGATASDNLDGTISEDIITTNPVNTNTVGTYIISYNISDRAGNPATEITRTVTVVSNLDQNDDGTADAIQTNVVGLTNTVTEEPAVLEADEDCSVDTAVVQAEATNITQDTDYDYPEGLFSFKLICDAGHDATIKLYHYQSQSSQSLLRKYNPNTGDYFTIDDAQFTKTTINDTPVTVVTYQVKDGSERDMDGQVNGEIIDPAGIAQAEPSASNLAQTGTDSLPNAPFTLLGSISFVIILIVSRRKYLYRAPVTKRSDNLHK